MRNLNVAESNVTPAPAPTGSVTSTVQLHVKLTRSEEEQITDKDWLCVQPAGPAGTAFVETDAKGRNWDWQYAVENPDLQNSPAKRNVDWLAAVACSKNQQYYASQVCVVLFANDGFTELARSNACNVLLP